MEFLVRAEARLAPFVMNKGIVKEASELPLADQLIPIPIEELLLIGSPKSNILVHIHLENLKKFII